ncbi:MAG: ABC transporter substrate-binding protein [Desulfovibrionales bacterium]
MSAVSLVALLLVIFGCGQESDLRKDQTAGKGLADVQQVTGSGSTLTFYNWEEYTGSATLEQFEKETGIAVNLITFDDDEEIIGAVQSGGFDGDLVVVSESLAAEMMKAKLLSPIDPAALPNLKHLDPDFLREKGDHLQYAIPYMIGTTGMAVNTKLIMEGETDSWNLLWDERYRGRLAMLNNPFEVIAATGKLLGYGVNPSGEETLDEVQKKLLNQKELLAGYFDPAAIREKMAAEEIWAAQTYSGDALMTTELNEDVVYVLPKEGGVSWMDVFVIPRGSAHVSGALAFINFVHRPEVIGRIVSEVWTATPNRAAREFIDPEVLEDPAVYPDEEALHGYEFFGDMGSGESVRKRIEIWSDLTSQE